MGCPRIIATGDSVFAVRRVVDGTVGMVTDETVERVQEATDRRADRTTGIRPTPWRGNEQRQLG